MILADTLAFLDPLNEFALPDADSALAQLRDRRTIADSDDARQRCRADAGIISRFLEGENTINHDLPRSCTRHYETTLRCANRKTKYAPKTSLLKINYVRETSLFFLSACLIWFPVGGRRPSCRNRSATKRSKGRLPVTPFQVRGDLPVTSR